MARAKAGGVSLAGEGGLQQQLAKRVLESALEGELTAHPGHEVCHGNERCASWKVPPGGLVCAGLGGARAGRWRVSTVKII